MEETFEYDRLNRLTEIRQGMMRSGAMTYDAYGRMTSKTAGSQPVFSGAVYDVTSKPHAMDKAVTPTGVFPSAPQTVAYTGFDKVLKVKQGSDSLVYCYGHDRQRIFMEEHVGNTVRTKRYVGSCEYVTETTGNNSTSQCLTYLTGPTGIYAVVETENGTNTVHYIVKDNLGSWTVVADSIGKVEQRLSYDAWGNLRNSNTWSGSYTGTPMFDRGFTGHEHLTSFGLINMNGRMYDPMMSSFLSVDQFVQGCDNSQGFNRYAYCMNNPLRYIDPSGWKMKPTPGRTSNSNDYYRDIYTYVERALEPRDLGLLQLPADDPTVVWMEENEMHGGGACYFVEEGGNITCIFGYGDPNAVKVKGKGACLYASLGMVCKRLNYWDLNPVFWKNQEELYYDEKKQHGYDSNNIEDFVQWVGEKNNIDFIFEKIAIINIPDAHKEKSQVLIVMQLSPEYIIQNEGSGGHVVVLNTFSQSSFQNQTMFSMSFGDPSPQRFLYDYKTISPYKLPVEVNSWLFYKFKITNNEP